MIRMISGGGPYPVGAWTAFTPTGVVPTAGTITTLGTLSGRHMKLDKTVFFEMRLDITTNGTGSGSIQVDLPFGPAAANFVAVGRDRVATGKMVFGYIGNTTSVMTISFYDNTYPGADLASLIMTGVYEIT